MRRKVLLVIILLLCVSALNAVSTNWFYNTLNRKQQDLYNQIGDAVLHCSEKVDDVPYDGTECLRIYLGYLDDHPGIFWVESGIQYGTYLENGKTKHSIVFNYTHQDNLQTDQTRFINLVSRFSDYLKDELNDYVKLYHIYDYLASTIEYSTAYPDQTMWSVFFEGIGVCAGFARSFQYLALLEGIPAVVVHGWTRNEDGSASDIGHIWVMAEIDGKWYHFDPTWALSYLNGDVDFTYFCRSQKRMELTHVIDSDYPIPESTDDSLSYVKMMGRYITVYSERGVKDIIRKALEKGDCSFTIEFSSLGELNKAIRSLFDEERLFAILQNLGRTNVTEVSYSIDVMVYSLTLILN